MPPSSQPIRCPFCYAEWENDPTAEHKPLTALAIHLSRMNDDVHAEWRWHKLVNLTSIYRQIEAERTDDE